MQAGDDGDHNRTGQSCQSRNRGDGGGGDSKKWHEHRVAGAQVHIR